MAGHRVTIILYTITILVGQINNNNIYLPTIKCLVQLRLQAVFQVC